MNKLPLPVQSALWWLLPLVALAVTFGLETDWGRAVEARAQAAEPIQPKPVATALLPEYEIAGGVAAHAETVERTLFNPTRRPAPTLAQDGAGPGQMKRGQFALTGTMLVDGKSTAFLREVAGNKSRHVRAGDTINGMRVAEVKADRVTFTMGEESEELILKVATNPRPTPAPVVAAAQPPAQAAASGAQPAHPNAPTAQAATAPAAATGAGQTALERRRAARAAAAAAAAGSGTTPPPQSSNAWDSVSNAYQQRAGRRNQMQQ